MTLHQTLNAMRRHKDPAVMRAAETIYSIIDKMVRELGEAMLCSQSSQRCRSASEQLERNIGTLTTMANRALELKAHDGIQWPGKDERNAERKVLAELIHYAVRLMEGNLSKAVQYLGTTRSKLYRLIAAWPELQGVRKM